LSGDLSCGFELIEGISTDGDIYLASKGTPNVNLEVAILGRALGSDRWRILERPCAIIVGRKRMKEIRAEIERGAKIADMVPAPGTQTNWGRF
jgi:hypothetical protein